MYAGVIIIRIKDNPKVLIKLITATNTSEGKRLLRHLENWECNRFRPEKLYLYESIRCSLDFVEFYYRHKKFERNGNIYEECSAQICVKTGKKKILIRCDNSDEYTLDPNMFHMDVEIIDNKTRKRKKIRIRKKLYYRPCGNEFFDSWGRGRFAVRQILKYIEKDFPHVPLYVLLPPLTQVKEEIVNEILKMKPPDVSITDFSFLLMTLFYLIPQDKPENLHKSLIKLAEIARDILTGKLTYEIYIRRCLLPFPIPIIAFPKSYLKIDVWTEKPVHLNFIPIGKVIEKQKS